jgi:hypothetical protein
LCTHPKINFDEGLPVSAHRKLDGSRNRITTKTKKHVSSNQHIIAGRKIQLKKQLVSIPMKMSVDLLLGYEIIFLKNQSTNVTGFVVKHAKLCIMKSVDDLREETFICGKCVWSKLYHTVIGIVPLAVQCR